MRDPAVEAARAAFLEQWPDQGDFEFGYSIEGRFGVDAAREALKPIRELHKPEWSSCLDHCCSGENCKRRTRICAGGCDEWVNDNYDFWPCATARLVYTEEELT